MAARAMAILLTRSDQGQRPWQVIQPSLHFSAPPAHSEKPQFLSPGSQRNPQTECMLQSTLQLSDPRQSTKQLASDAQVVSQV